MKTDKRIFLYMEGELSPEEKISFEKELKNSPELQNEIKLYRDFFSAVEVTKNVSANSSYFNSITPEFRRRLEKTRQKKYFPRIAYAFPVLAILFLVLFFMFNNNEQIVVNKQSLTANNLNGNGIYEIMDYSIDELIPKDLSANDQDEYNSELNNLIEKELNISSDSTKFLIADKVLDYNSIIDNISEKDADIVYKDILNKKF